MNAAGRTRSLEYLASGRPEACAVCEQAFLAISLLCCDCSGLTSRLSATPEASKLAI